MANTSLVKFDDVNNKIIELRELQVILDSDVTQFFGVETRDINKAVKNNPDKFPQRYIFELSKNEKEEVVENFHHLHKIKFSPQLLKAFTEKGLYMLATILKSKKATHTTLAIIEAYSRIKNLFRHIKELSEERDEKMKQNLLQKSGEMIAQILDDDLKMNESETTIEINFAD